MQGVPIRITYSGISEDSEEVICHVLLEEQVAIFLYASVTGLTVQHLGERYQ